MILSVIFLQEEVTTHKVLGMGLMGIGSVALLVGASGDASANTGAGIVQVITSAFIYAAYGVLYSKKVQPEFSSSSQIMEWTGMMGLSTVLAAPFMAALGLSSGFVQQETFEFLWHEPEMHLYLLTSGITSLVYMPLFLLAICLSSPLFVSAGCVMTIPASFLLDYLTTGQVMATPEIVGSALIIGGFLSVLETSNE
ncbi:hypothetical protein CYMTET_42339 [Cymbomonas tetramitiformis]|uniref:EamA domain-containing protein n=1 Tax=Cymbomonas tetramitiformis TaxID=36881 RepID=A0AAE0F1L7_9CHLO|nr:hypothetical protein CYMTET_42339 [Cymbomonas tetramitiformis]